jgi:putative copper export protein
MLNLLAGAIEFVHIKQVSASFTFRLGQVLLHIFFIFPFGCIFQIKIEI